MEMMEHNATHGMIKKKVLKTGKIIRLADYRARTWIRRTNNGVFFVTRSLPIAGIPANI
jgi:hypothetical protein